MSTIDGAAARGEAALAAFALALIAFGLLLVLAPEPAQRLFAWIAYGSADRVAAFGADAVAYVQLVHAVLGAIVVGWGATMLAVARHALPRDPDAAPALLAWPAVAWFVLDTSYSLASGFWRNAVFNACVAVPFAAALLATAGARRREVRS